MLETSQENLDPTPRSREEPVNHNNNKCPNYQNNVHTTSRRTRFSAGDLPRGPRPDAEVVGRTSQPRAQHQAQQFPVQQAQELAQPP